VSGGRTVSARTTGERGKSRSSSRAFASVFAALTVLTVVLGACTSATLQNMKTTAAPQPRRQAELAPGEEREHYRILAAYGGQYDNEKLQGMLERTVDKLVAASERPDLKYEVTILNSPAVNAFAIIYNPPDAGGHVAFRFLTSIRGLRYKLGIRALIGHPRKIGRDCYLQLNENLSEKVP